MRRPLQLFTVGLLAAVVAFPSNGQPPKAEPSPDAPKAAGDLRKPQEANAKLFKELSQGLLRLAQKLENDKDSPQNQERAKTIRAALKVAEESGVENQFQKLVGGLGKGATGLQDFDQLRGQDAELAKTLQEIVNILMTDDESARIKAEIAKLTEVLREVKDIKRRQEIVRAMTESQKGDTSKIAKTQGDLARQTKDLADRLGGKKGGDGKDSEKPDPKAEGKGEGKPGDKSAEPKPDAAEGKDGDAKSKGQDGDAKPGQPKDGKAGDQKPGDAKPGEAKAGDAKPGEAKQGDAKPGEAKPGDAKSGEPKAGDAKPGDAKQGEPKAGDAKSGDGKPGEPKGGDAKPSDGKPGEAKGGESKPNDGKPGEAKPGEQKSGPSKGEAKPPSDQKQASARDTGADPRDKQANNKGGQQQQGGQQGGQPGQPGQGGEQQPQQNQPPGRKQVQEAYPHQQGAEEDLKKPDRQNASKKESKAIEDLAKAIDELEKRLKQLREEEMQRLLANLEARCGRMLAMQIEVYEGTKAVHATVVKNNNAKNTADIQKSQQLATREQEIVVEADKALKLLETEGSAVAFALVLEEVRGDMAMIQKRLDAAYVDTDTQGIEENVIAMLKDMVAALKKAQQELEEKKQQPQQQQQGKPGDQKLIDLIAELRLIRSMQVQVNQRTTTNGKKSPGEQATDPLIQGELRQLSARQAKLMDMIQKIATQANQ